MEIHEIIINKAIKFNNIITYMSKNNNVLRDKGLLESAICNAFQSMFGNDLYPTHEEKAYVLFLNIAKNHPFIDGNKRTAALVSDFYLMENGLELDLETKEKFKFMLNILEKKIDVEQGLFIFKELVKPITSIKRNILTKDKEEDFIYKYNKINETINDNLSLTFDLRKNILNKFILEYSKTNCINYIDLMKSIENLNKDNLNKDNLNKDNLNKEMEIIDGNR